MQLPLGLSLKDDATFENFYAGSNSELITTLKKTAAGAGEKIIYLSGGRGLGCTHLLQACCHYAHQHQLPSVYLPMEHFLAYAPEVVSGFESLALICIDDIHCIAGKSDWEEAVFHLYNRVHQAGGRLVIAGNNLPQQLNLSLLDLVSRLSWGMVYALHPLIDPEKLTMLVMRAYRRGMTLSEETAKYILTHCPRHTGTLMAALDALDKASLAAQRRLTVPFVKEVLGV